MSEKIKKQVTVTRVGSYERQAFGYGTETVRIYTMTDEDNKVYVWKTTGSLWFKTGFNEEHGVFPKTINKGDKVVITASVKGETEYKGEKQTAIQRVKVVEVLYRAETWEERREREAKEKADRIKAQLDSVGEDDQLITMTYKNYKEHYADCEVIEDSFERTSCGTFIQVIVRAGRMKASGVRGKHFRGYELRNDKNEYIVYRAVSEENALKRAQKNYPDESWECVKIYR